MTLTMRPTGLGHGVYKDSIDYGVFSGEWQIGRIYERRGFPDHVRWVQGQPNFTGPGGRQRGSDLGAAHSDPTDRACRQQRPRVNTVNFALNVGWRCRPGPRGRSRRR